jgi:hypothetical protein
LQRRGLPTQTRPVEHELEDELPRMRVHGRHDGGSLSHKWSLMMGLCPIPHPLRGFASRQARRYPTGGESLRPRNGAPPGELPAGTGAGRGPGPQPHRRPGLLPRNKSRIAPW